MEFSRDDKIISWPDIRRPPGRAVGYASVVLKPLHGTNKCICEVQNVSLSSVYLVVTCPLMKHLTPALSSWKSLSSHCSMTEVMEPHPPSVFKHSRTFLWRERGSPPR